MYDASQAADWGKIVGVLKPVNPRGNRIVPEHSKTTQASFRPRRMLEDA